MWRIKKTSMLAGLWIFALTVVLSPMSMAQRTFFISGRVTSSTTGDGIPNVSVLGILTDQKGFYVRKDLLRGDYPVEPFRSGYTFSPARRTTGLSYSLTTLSSLSTIARISNPCSQTSLPCEPQEAFASRRG